MTALPAMPDGAILVHATCVAWAGRGALLRGRSGSGKSDLALRLIDQGADLVADDQVVLTRRGDAIVATPPAVLAGRIEVRGIGIVERPWARAACLVAVFDLTERAAIARLPDDQTVRLAGLALPLFRVAPFEASAPSKVRAAMDLASRRRAGSEVDHRHPASPDEIDAGR